MTYPKLSLLAGQDRRLRAGHPWVYSNELKMDAAAKALEPGTPVQLANAAGKAMAVAQFNPHSLIAARVLSRNQDVTIDVAFLERRLGRALRLRERLHDQPYYRLVHAEADGLPGLVIDRFGGALVVQANSAGMDRLKPFLLDAIEQVLETDLVIFKNDSPARTREGLELGVDVVKGEIDGPIQLLENGLTFFADPLNGQKTGWYFDQRENRAFATRLAKGERVLDLFSYGGGFGITALAAGASEALAIDRSEGALALAKMAAEQNGVDDRLTLAREEGFAALERLAGEKQRFGLVVADPPSFVKSKRELKSGLKGYRKLARAAASLVRPEGCLMIASCSHNVPIDQFRDEARKGLSDAGRGGRLLHQSGASADHPSHPMLPESAYLKCLVYMLD
ncbi:MAG: class I SAM-dependent rRNA methyltransferase [Alphaproteobacteria bacterium]|nr:class I SAM-dependent rRNA methyltransferase [Alphaproteobacteria bacterium]